MFHALTKVNQVCIVLDLIRQNANHSHNVANPEQQIANAEVDANEDCIFHHCPFSGTPLPPLYYILA